MTSLFESAERENRRRHQPLAARMRPTTLDQYVGQSHLLGEGQLLRRMIESRTLASVIFSGPPGTGKTTLAMVIAREIGATMRTLSATSSGVKDVREVLAWAADEVASGGNRPILFIDEIHRFSRSQQDALLPDVESGTVSLIGATTSNPHFAVNSALLSRSQLFLLHPIAPEDIESLLRRAIVSPEGLGVPIQTVTEDAIQAIAKACGGDARRALTAIEIAIGSRDGKNANDSSGNHPVDTEAVMASLGSSVAGYDGTGDDHYDLASALIKCIRGSDVDAAIYWLARMLEGGEDIRFLTRRLVILASEDVGNADPAALSIAVACMQACEFVGLPECQLTLSQTVAYLSLAPKSNAATSAIGRARRDVRQNPLIPVPSALRDSHYAGAESLGSGDGYANAHAAPEGIVAGDHFGNHPPYYQPVDRGNEAEMAKRLAKIRRQLSGDHSDDADPSGEPSIGQ